MAKSIFITCQGTRGDVQPYCNLGSALKERGWKVLIGAPAEFKSFIAGHGLDFMDIGPSPTEKQYENAVSDKAQKSRFTRPLAAYNAAMDLFNPKDKAPFTLTWFKKIIEGCREMRPDILLLVFTAWSGAAAIPSLLQLPTRVVISYPMPMAPTSSFSVSMAGTGYSSSWRWLNSMQWKISERMIVQKIHLKAAQRNLKLAIEEETAAGRALPGASTTVLDNSMNTASLPALFAFSPSLLPKPTDWPANYHVIGQLTKKKTAADAHKPLPAPLQAYLDDCSKKNLHVIYIGFGSLGFFEKSRVTAILDAAAAAVTKVAAEHPVRAVIQTTLSSTPGKTGTLTSSSSSSSETQPFLTFSESVDHTALFPQTSLVVSHGGVGTVATALAAGKPVLSMCCLPTADQSFWADLCYRQKLSPQWFWVDDLTPERMAAGIEDALKNMELYTKNAEALAKDMANEDAVKAALKVLEAEVAKIVKTGDEDDGGTTTKRRSSYSTGALTSDTHTEVEVKVMGFRV